MIWSRMNGEDDSGNAQQQLMLCYISIKIVLYTNGPPLHVSTACLCS